MLSSRWRGHARGGRGGCDYYGQSMPQRVCEMADSRNNFELRQLSAMCPLADLAGGVVRNRREVGTRLGAGHAQMMMPARRQEDKKTSRRAEQQATRHRTTTATPCFLLLELLSSGSKCNAEAKMVRQVLKPIYWRSKPTPPTPTHSHMKAVSDTRLRPILTLRRWN